MKVAFNIYYLPVLLFLSQTLVNCTSNKEYSGTTSNTNAGLAVFAPVRPEVVEEKDTFMLGEEIVAKVFLNRTDYKTLAQQAGIKDYLKVYYFHGEHVIGDSLAGFEEAEVEFDTGYVKFMPKRIDSEYDYIAYPYDVVIKIDFDDDHEGVDTSFIWRQEAIIKK